MTIDMPGSPSRFVVFSDVHGNLPALDTLLKEIDSCDYEACFCLGDVVGYGANPNQCCDRIVSRKIPTVMGNHDYVAVMLEDVEYFNEVARTAIKWTHERLVPEHVDFLKSLPHRIDRGDFTFVHASPFEPPRWHYVLTRSDARLNFDAFDKWICFVGHSHQAFVVELLGRELTCPDPEEIELDREKRYIVNVGSVGQPRDHNPDLCYVSVDLAENRLRFHRVAYPVHEAQRAIIQAGLPMELADRLGLGW
ncbi:metallophosphoesterase family protein [Candidatus Sumerlaeota bacterium]|nr:metallophosphoesterase family protein [Candidatus Sumerlaeota bacterium]